MKGYLKVMPVSEIERERAKLEGQNYDKVDFHLDIASSPESRGWIPLTAAIKQGGVLKVSAERIPVRYEARFEMRASMSQGKIGSCEIGGGPLACHGTFVDVSPAPASPGCTLSFVCHSASGDGRSLLRWQIQVADFVDADSLTEKE